MPQSPTSLADEVGIALANLADAAGGALTPTLRLGVTGLSRAGKTIFITALVHNLLTNGRMPGFAAAAEGRFIGARLAEYPEASIPRFASAQSSAGGWTARPGNTTSPPPAKNCGPLLWASGTGARGGSAAGCGASSWTRAS